MMNVFAREPVFTLKKEIFAYQFIYRNGLNGSFPLALTSMDPYDEVRSGLNIDELMQVNMTIINLLPEALEEFAEMFSPSDVIIEISEINSNPKAALLSQIIFLKTQGFKLVANQHQLQWPEFMEHVDFLKLNIMNNTPTEIKNHKLRLANTNVKLIATNVHSQFQFEQCQTLNVDYLQGFFFLEKE
ncbi:MAG: EAL and modified HD-GYP domain-containing signal transduction protein, partial [Yoonia sp.]